MALKKNLVPGAYAEKNPLGGLPNVAIPYVTPAIVASTLGSGKVVLSETVSGHTLSGTDVLANVASGSGLLRTVERVSDRSDGVANYFQGTHFQITSDMLDWSIRPTLTSPAPDLPITATAGSGLSSGTYYYVITVRNNASGESSWVAGQNFASAALTDTGTIRLGWEAIDNALDYRVYRTTQVSGGAPDFDTLTSGSGLLATVANATTYTDDATDTVASASNPVSANTAYDEPLSGGNYTVDYTYTTYEFNVPRKFRSLEEVNRYHGFGSEASIMAEFAMSTVPGRGNSAPALWIVAAGDSSNPTDYPAGAQRYQTALTGLNIITDEQLVVVMGQPSGGVSETLRQNVRQHVEERSELANKSERIGVTYSANNTAIGSSGDDTSLLGQAANLSSKRVVHIAVDSGAATADIQSSSTNTRARGTMQPQYMAAAVAGRISALTDSAVPLTRKQIIGPVRFSGSLGREYNPKELQDLRDGGICIVDYKSDGFWQVFQGVTTETSNQDDMELSVVLASDTIAFAWRAAIDGTNGQGSLIGAKLTQGLLTTVQQRTIVVLDDLVKNQIIKGYDLDSILVEQDSSTKTQVNVSFDYEPVWPVNTIILTFSSSFSLAG